MGWKPVRESPFGSPGSRRGDTAGPPSVTGASRARPGARIWVVPRKELPFVPWFGAEGFFFCLPGSA